MAPTHEPRWSPVWFAVSGALAAVALELADRLKVVPLPGWSLGAIGVFTAAVAGFITLIAHNTAASEGWTWTYVYRVAVPLVYGAWATWTAYARWTPVLALVMVIAVASLCGMGAVIPYPDPPAPYVQAVTPATPVEADRRPQHIRDDEALLIQASKIKGLFVADSKPWTNGDGYRLHLDLPVGCTADDLIQGGVGSKFAGAKRLPAGCTVRIEEGDLQGTAFIDVMTRNTLVDVRAVHVEPTTAASINDDFPVLVTPRGQWLSICLRIYSMIVGGTIGSGKTTLLHRIIMFLARCADALIWVVDLNGAGVADPWVVPWATGRAGRPTIDWVADDEVEAAVMLAVGNAIAKDRKGNPEARQRKRDANTTILPVDHRLPAIVVITDEGGEVRQAVSLVGQIAAAGITRLAQIGRAEGLRVIMSVLRGTSDLTDKGLRVVAAIRLCLRMDEHDEYAHVLGANPPKVKLGDTPGAGFLRTARITQPVLGNTLGVDLNGIDRHAVATAHLRPDLDERGRWAASRVGARVVMGGREPSDELMTHQAMRDAEAGLAYENRWERKARWLAEMRGEDYDEPEPQPVAKAASPAPVGGADDESALSAWSASVRAQTAPPAPAQPAPARAVELATADGAKIYDFPARPGQPVPAAAPDTAREQILGLVRTAGPGGISAADLERGVSVARSRVYEVMRKLRDDEKLIATNAAGLYVMAVVDSSSAAN